MNDNRIAQRVVLAGTAIFILGIGIMFFAYRSSDKIGNFEECKNAGYPVMESYPRQCHANNQTFTQDLR